MSSTVAVPVRLGGVDDRPHLLLLSFGQVDISRREILLQSGRLGRAGNGDHSLRGYPCKCDLCDGASLLGRQLLNLINDGAVLVEVVALKFGSW